MKERDIFSKGYNAGYLLQQHEPELASALSKSTNQSDHLYMRAMQHGREAYLREMRDRLKEYTKDYPEHSKPKGRDNDRGIDR